MKAVDKTKQYLNEFRLNFEPCFNQYLNERLKQLGKINFMGRILTEKICNFSVNGGKRIRAALVILGYRAGGENNERDVFPAAIGVELLHNFFLIHDDIIDQSEKRRGRPTVHKIFEADYRQLLKDPIQCQHFSYSMALLAGDLCCSIGYEALTKSNLPAERILLAIQRIHGMVNVTAIGQGLDIVRPLRKKISEDAVNQIYLLKTAKYTVEGPLTIGLILAGNAGQLLQEIRRYAIPVGIAFQIQDDILGVFGTEDQLGKSVTSDIKEGKQTILTVAAQRLSNDAQRKRLKSLIGNPRISSADIKEVQEIMKTSGALDYARSRAQTLIEEGKAVLSILPISPDIREILDGLADYIVERTF